MKFRSVLYGTALIVVSAAITTQVVSQDTKTKADPPRESSPEEKAWEAAAQVGAQHAHLKALVGTWKADCKWWMAGPDSEPMISTGSSVHRLILGDRWLHQEFTGDMMGQPFQGVGHLGYDNVSKKYIGSWIDTMMTGMMTHSGTIDTSGKVLTMAGEFKDPMGNTIKDRNITRIIDNNKHTFEMYHTGGDGKEVKVGEIVYTRTK